MTRPYRPRKVRRLNRRQDLAYGFSSPAERGVPVYPHAPDVLHDLFYLIDEVRQLSYRSVEHSAGYSEGLLSRARKGRATMKVDALVDVLEVLGYDLQIIERDTGNVLQKPER